MAILSIHVDLYPPILRPMVIQILMATRLVVTRQWKSNTSPNIREVVNKVDEAFKYELIMTSIEGKLPLFYKQWDP